MGPKSGDYDVIVVGAGLVGSAAARHLVEISGLQVLLIGPEEPKVSPRPGLAHTQVSFSHLCLGWHGKAMAHHNDVYSYKTWHLPE